jgi:hypothetical protein
MMSLLYNFQDIDLNINKIEEDKMERTTVQPTEGTWDKLPSEKPERVPKLDFPVNVTRKVVFLNNAPREIPSETGGVYYIFDIEENKEKKIISTSAWSLLRELKLIHPLAGKVVGITKRMEKGKQFFEVRVES